MRVPSIDIYHRIRNPSMDEKVELQTPLAFARKHLESSAIYGWCLTRTLSHSLLKFVRAAPLGCGKEEGFLSTIKKFAIVNQAVAKNKGASQARKANKAIARSRPTQLTGTTCPSCICFLSTWIPALISLPPLESHPLLDAEATLPFGRLCQRGPGYIRKRVNHCWALVLRSYSFNSKLECTHYNRQKGFEPNSQRNRRGALGK